MVAAIVQQSSSRPVYLLHCSFWLRYSLPSFTVTSTCRRKVDEGRDTTTAARTAAAEAETEGWMDR